MTPEDEWDAIRSRRAPLFGVAGMGMLRVALLFGSAAVALALILAPMADRYDKSQFVGLDGLDFMATGSTGRSRRLHDPPQRAAGARFRLHHLRHTAGTAATAEPRRFPAQPLGPF